MMVYTKKNPIAEFPKGPVVPTNVMFIKKL